MLSSDYPRSASLQATISGCLFIQPENRENGAATCSPSGETLDLARELFRPFSVLESVNFINIGIVNRENMWLETKSRNNSKFILGCVYQSRTSTMDDEKKLHRLWPSRPPQIAADVIKMVDFNNPEIDQEFAITEKTKNQQLPALHRCNQ